MVVRWNSRPINERALPDGLRWRPEPVKDEYRVHVALANYADHTYRRVTFPDGSHIYSELEYQTARATA